MLLQWVKKLVKINKVRPRLTAYMRISCDFFALGKIAHTTKHKSGSRSTLCVTNLQLVIKVIQHSARAKDDEQRRDALQLLQRIYVDLYLSIVSRWIWDCFPWLFISSKSALACERATERTPLWKGIWCVFMRVCRHFGVIAKNKVVFCARHCDFTL